MNIGDLILNRMVKTLNNQEKIEKLLKNYKANQASIEIRLMSYAPGYSLQAVDYDKVSTGKTNNIYSEVENYVIKTFGKDSKVWRLIHQNKIIEAALNSLSRDEYYIISMIYFEKKPYNYIAENLYKDKILCESTIGKKKKEILANLEDVGILEAYNLK